MDDDKQKTVSFKLDTEFQKEVMEKLQEVSETQKMTRKEWFERAFALMKTQELKEQSPQFSVSLSELEGHTTRIYEIINEMIKQSTNLREQAVHTLEQQLEQQREIASDYQSKVQGANDERDQALEDLEASRSEQNQLIEQLEETKESLETNKLLINEYKEKNDTLTGLVTKYESYVEENEQLKETLANERSSHQSKIDDLTNQNNERTAKIKELGQQINSLSEAHKATLERLEERKDLEREKALLKAERGHQKALSDANNEYTNKVQSLYEKMDNQRQNYEEKIAELERQLASQDNKK